MITINQIATKTGGYLARELSMNRKQEIKMIYGMELLLAALLKSISILLLAFLLGIFRETMIIILAAGIFRIVSGGEHCQAFYRCLIGGLVVFLALGFLTKELAPLITYQQINILVALSFPSLALIIWRYAPADTENKPIEDETEKLRFKKMSLLVTAIFLFLIILSLTLGALRQYILPIMVGLVWQAFTITPLGYRFIKGIDSLLRF